MSTDETPPRGGAVRRRFRWPMSLVNTAVVVACLVAALIAVAAGRPAIAVPLLVGALFGAVGAVLARRRSAGDLERVNAMEYADERERAAGVKGLAAVGVVALVLALAQGFAVVLLRDAYPLDLATFGGLLLLSVVWFAANWFFVRRG